jgi:hypothetical protein
LHQVQRTAGVVLVSEERGEERPFRYAFEEVEVWRTGG